MLGHSTFLLKIHKWLSIAFIISLKILPDTSKAPMMAPATSWFHLTPLFTSFIIFQFQWTAFIPARLGALITHHPGIFPLHCPSPSLIFVWLVPIPSSNVSLNLPSSDRSSMISQTTLAPYGGQGSSLANNKNQTLTNLIKQFFLDQ